MTEIKSICVYCGSHPGTSPQFMETAYEFGKIMAAHNIRLVYGAGTNGVMGAVARGVHENGGTVLGIIPQFLLSMEANNTPHTICDEVIVTQTMHERKQTMFDNADAFVTLPGGIGTLEEIVETLTWAQLGRHTKPMCFLDLDAFWQPLVELLDHMKTAGFIHSEKKLHYHFATAPEDILPALQA